MKYLFIGCCLLLLFSQCQDIKPIQTIEEKEATVTPSPANTFSYLALGDFYTIGESVQTAQRYPVQLVARLAEQNIYMDTLHIVATTGWTTDELQKGIVARNDLLDTYSIVTLLIGVNNQYRGYPLDNYSVEFTELLEQAIDFAGGDTSRVTVISIPDYAYTPFGKGSQKISQDIDRFNATNKAITTAYKVDYIDITSISREGLDNPNLVADDNLHPSGTQYSRWVEKLYPVILKQLKP